MPRRDRAVTNEAAERLIDTATGAALQALAEKMRGDDNVVPTFDQWREAGRRGIDMPTPRARLPRRQPPRSFVSVFYKTGSPALELDPAGTRPVLRMATEIERLEAHALRAALNRLDADGTGPLAVDQVDEMAGYAWYDALDTITAVTVTVTTPDGGWRS